MAFQFPSLSLDQVLEVYQHLRGSYPDIPEDIASNLVVAERMNSVSFAVGNLAGKVDKLNRKLDRLIRLAEKEEYANDDE